MNTTSLRLATAFGLFVAAFTAHSQQSSVTVYGRLNVSVNRLNFSGTSTAPSTHLTTVSSDTSWLGLRGIEDLGGGARAYFKLEHGLQADTGVPSNATAFWNREAYVGLGSNAWGSVQLGSQFTPNIWMSGRVDPMRRANLGGDYSLLQAFPWQRGYTAAFNNAVQYMSPQLAGFTGRLMAAAGEGAATGKAYAGSIDYAAGPLFAGLAYEQTKVVAATVGLAGAPVKAQLYSAGATYDFKAIKLHGWYQTHHVSGVGNANGYLAGVTVPVSGESEVRGTYLRRSQPGASATLPSVGYFHFLSKRTTAYTAVGRLNNHGTAASVMFPANVESASAGLPKPGQAVTGVQLGLLHVF